MKDKRRLLLQLAPLPAALLATAHAASDSWATATNGNWSDTAKWTGASVPNGASQIATFNQDFTGQTVTVDGNYTVGQILATDSADAAAAGLTITGGTLTLDNGASKPVISTNTNFSENKWFSVSSTLAGTNGFERTGVGYMRLYGTNTFTGNVKLTGGATGSFLAINADANLGNAANDIEVATSASATGLYNEASAGSFILNADRNIITSGTGDFWVKNKSGANMTIAGAISGTARLRKNDAGTLTLTGANNFSGNTLLDGGSLVLSGGNNRLPSGSTVTFNSVSTLNLTNTTQTLNGLSLLATGVTNTISGSGGTLILQGTGDLTVNASATGTSLNMSGLSNFTFDRAANSFQLNANGASVANTVNLAKAGTNTINAINVRFGGGGAFAGQNVLVGLGQDNRVNASGEFLVGYYQGSGNVSFQSGLANPSLTVRGTGGGSNPTPIMSVGSTNSGGQSSTGILNLTGGSLDVIATEFNLARHFANSGGTTSNGTITMPAGTVVATTLNLAVKTNTTGAPTLTGTFNQSGGTVTATTLNLGNNANSESPNLVANYNLSGGTLLATTISGSGATYGASTVRNLNLSGGTLRNKAGGDLGVNGLANTSTGRINIAVSAASTLHADALSTITLGANTALTGAGSLSKNGAGSLVINGAATTYTGTLTLAEGTLGGATSLGGNLAVLSGATLAPGNSPGTMTVTGNLTLDGTYAHEFTGGGITADLVNVGGTLDLAGSSVSWTNLGTYTLGDRFTLFGYNQGSLVGTFDGYADDSYLTMGGGSWRIDYDDLVAGLNGGTGDRFVTITAALTPIPETSGMLAIAGLLGGAVLLRRRP